MLSQQPFSRHLKHVRWHFTSRSFRDVTNTDEELHILTYTRHSWPLSSKTFLADKSIVTRSIRPSPRTRVTHPCCLALSSGAVTTHFYDLGLLRLGIKPRSYVPSNTKLQRQFSGLTIRITSYVIFRPLRPKIWAYYFSPVCHTVILAEI